MPDILEHIKHQVLLCDGSMGGYSLNKAKKLGYLDPQIHFMGNNNISDPLNITHPELIRQVHLEYLRAGADILETNSFNANSLYFQRHLRDHGTHLEDFEELAAVFNTHAVEIAREAVDEFPENRTVFVVGGIGPGDYFGPGKFDLGSKHDHLLRSFTCQAEALLKAGVDAFLIETCSDPEQVKAAVEAFDNVRKQARKDTPILVSFRYDDEGLIAYWDSTREKAAYATPKDTTDMVAKYPIDALGANCMLPHTLQGPLTWMSKYCGRPIFCQPNAGENLISELKRAVVEHGVNIIGGCCQTTPADIHAMDEMLRSINPGHRRPSPAQRLSR